MMVYSRSTGHVQKFEKNSKTYFDSGTPKIDLLDFLPKQIRKSKNRSRKLST